MLKNRFSAALIALIVATAPAAAFAGAAVQEMIQDDAQIIAEDELLDELQEGDGTLPLPGDPDEPTGNLTEPDPDGEEPGEEGQPGEGEEPIDEEQPIDEEEPIGEENSTDGQEPVGDEGDVEEPAEEPVAEEEIIAEEPLEEEVLEEELLEEEVIVEPAAATLTIVQRLIVGGEIDDFIQVIEGLEVGQIVNLAEYIVDAEFVIYTGDVAEITLSEENSEVILEYALANAYEFEILEK